MSSTQTPSMTSTYSSTPTILLEYTYTRKPQAPIIQNSTNTNSVINTPFIVLLLCFMSITIICIIYNIVCVNNKKKRREAREHTTQQITVIQPIIHENPLHSVYRIHV